MTFDDEPADNLEPDPSITPELFREWRSPRFGATNPERLTNPVWGWLIDSRASAYAARQRFHYTPQATPDPGWSFARFGHSETALPDGRVVFIAGEHEDFYDPDFYIYNDVVVRHPDGRLEIFGYPRDVFPPTDFHSATLVGKGIVVIGSLGYPHDRAPGTTQVCVLDTDDYSISRMDTSGIGPGWIHDHSATLDGHSAIIVRGGKVETGRGAGLDFLDNGDEWRLDLESRQWTRVTSRGWRQWQVGRADHRSNQLWQLRSLAQFRGVRWAEEHRASLEGMIAQQMESVRNAYGSDPDLDLYATLFSPDIPHETLPDRDEELGVRRIRIDGTIVRYVDRHFAIKLVVEGQLAEATTATLVEDLRGKLSTLEHADYVAVELLPHSST